ncbi:MAG: hypothetical protein M0P40_06105 [Bacteroidales bacterium]|jgi:hypothetical protein|nr:hypothetical protein [Bacteroidales bacterium]
MNVVAKVIERIEINSHIWVIFYNQPIMAVFRKTAMLGCRQGGGSFMIVLIIE